MSRLPGARSGFTPHFGRGSMAALDGDSLSYLTIRQRDVDGCRFREIGVIGHGSRGDALAEPVVSEIRDWNGGGANNRQQHRPQGGRR